MAGTQISQRQRRRLYELANYKCQNKNCPKGGRFLQRQTEASVEHIIPKHLYVIFGFPDMYNEEENLTVLCRECNGAKGNMIDPKHPLTLKRLKELVTRWERFNGLKRQPNNYVFRNLSVKSDKTVTYFEAISTP